MTENPEPYIVINRITIERQKWIHSLTDRMARMGILAGDKLLIQFSFASDERRCTVKEADVTAETK